MYIYFETQIAIGSVQEDLIHESCEQQENVHVRCHAVINAQMKCISEQRSENDKLKHQVASLNAEIKRLKRSVINSLQKQVNYHSSQSKRKSEEIIIHKNNAKRARNEFILPEPATQADELLTAMVKRRNSPSTEPYPKIIKEFAFKLNYVAPRGFSITRRMLPGILPHPKSLLYWTRHVKIAPGWKERNTF